MLKCDLTESGCLYNIEKMELIMSEYEKRRFTAVDEMEIDTVLAEDIYFVGDLEFEGSLYIKGKVEGSIKAIGDLYIAENAEVKSMISADFVSVRGKVIGDILARRRVELFDTCDVDGDIVAPDMKMDPGCKFNGKCIMKSPEELQK